MRTQHYLLFVAAGVGLATGFVSSPRKKNRGIPAAEGPRMQAEATVQVSPELPEDPLPISVDTAGDLLNLPQDQLYNRLALWLLDAAEEEIAAFWKAWQSGAESDPAIEMLIFSQWSKRNPRGMIKAAKQAGKEASAWSAWAASDPQAALAAVESSGPMWTAVMQSLAASDPAWALRMLEKDPGLAKVFVWLIDIAREARPNDPRGQIEFLDRFDKFQASQQFKAWAKEDPLKALEWLNERGSPLLQEAYLEVTGRMELAELDKLAEEAPPGAMKRKLADAAFTRLAATDADKALEVARKSEVPRMAAERLAQVGRTMVSERPDEALGILEEILQRCPDASYRSVITRYPGGSRGPVGGLTGFKELLEALTARDPRQTLDSVIGLEKELPVLAPSTFERDSSSVIIAKEWVERDRVAFRQWCETANDPVALETAARVMASDLAQQMDFAGSVEWSMKISDTARRESSVTYAFSQWAGTDPERARRWFENAELDEKLRGYLTGILSHKP
jgi:hypothetical protein